MACGRQTDMQTVFLLMLKPLEILDGHDHHLSYQGGSKSPPHIFFVLTNLDCFDLGRFLKSYVLSQGSDVTYICTFLIDKQTDSQTDKHVGRHIYSAVLELTDLMALFVDGLSLNCQ